MKKTIRSPWSWIPTLYFAEGLPYVAVMTVSVIMYKRFGLSNTEIALYTSWLYLPWVIKPFWSPFVDILKTKRCRPGGRSIYPAHAVLPAGITCLLLAHGFQFSHTRYRCRRLLHASAGRFAAILLRRHSQHLLSPCFDHRSGIVGSTGRISGKIDRQNSICLEPHLLHSGRHFSGIFCLSPFCSALPKHRYRKIGPHIP